MNNKVEIEEAVRQGRIVAIVRGFAPDICLRLAESYVKGGIRLVEVTFAQKAPETWKSLFPVKWKCWTAASTRV